MGKRKRHDDKRDTDIGLAAALAHFQSSELPSKKPQVAAEDDDDNEGWTLVGGPKKRSEKKQRTDEDGNHRTRPAHDAEAESERRKHKDKQERRGHRDSHGHREPREHRDHRDRRNHRNTSRDRSHPSPKMEKKHQDEEQRYPSIVHSHNTRLQSPLKISDLQSLVLYILADGFGPQWVAVQHRSLIRQVVVLMVPGLEQGMFTGRISLESAKVSPSPPVQGDGALMNGLSATDSMEEQQSEVKRLVMSPDDYYPVTLRPDRLPDALKSLSDIFPHVWPIRALADSNGPQVIRVHSPMHSMLNSYIPKTKEEKQMRKNPRHKGPLPQSGKSWDYKRTPITEYIADLLALNENDYVIHPAWYTTLEAKEAGHQRRMQAKQASEDGWVDSNVASLEEGDVPDDEIEQGSVTVGRELLTVDCEMCRAEDGTLVLTRISLLDWDGNVVLDELVRPDIVIQDYLTQYSGITEAMLKDVTTTLSDIQQRLLKMITPRTILVGHSLNSDLLALKLTHPFIVDTAILYPHPRGPPYRQSLKFLSQRYLSQAIQKGDKGHDSVEDARACLHLVKQKCERGPLWGSFEANMESIFKRLGRATRPGGSSRHGGGPYRTGAVVDWGEPSRGYGGEASLTIGCQSDEEVVQGIKDAIKGRATNKDGTSSKVDLVWGRLRELELVRGWWDDAKTADVEAIRKKAVERVGRAPVDSEEESEVTSSELGEAVARTVDHIAQVYQSLPPCTALIVYSGTGDPREVRRLQSMRKQFKEEYATKNWDNLSVKWTDTENQALSQAYKNIREGIGFMAVK
ncbi:hypothetical protein BCR34DRAFT_605005 [Clohesyomyces aquaticus]|uniref:Exonuclease domain-containing protein n=1 Tax=Clohesyomyces aquaticus TaxID=1231657 RepID=A0A1Y1Z2G0_9PLEO|nr:hypothetical protein BCR34DRAFT_605005 [Clohesyomyces aquaticus]